MQGKKLKQIDIVLENCEVISVPIERVHHFYANNITNDMRIIHNNLETQKTIPKTQEYDCEYCGSTIEVDADDLHEGWLGAMFFTCPVCGKENMSDIETELPTKDSVEFPKHFRKSSVDNDAVDISDEEIQKVIRELANKL